MRTEFSKTRIQLREEFLKANPLKVRKAKEYEAVERGEIYSDEDKSKLVDSLRGLGYIE